MKTFAGSRGRGSRFAGSLALSAAQPSRRRVRGLARRSAKREGGWFERTRQSAGHRQLRADDRLDAGALRGEVKARRAVDAVAIEQRERRIAERRGAVDQRFGQRGAVEKRKGGGSVQFDIHGAHVADALVVNPFDKPPVACPVPERCGTPHRRRTPRPIRRGSSAGRPTSCRTSATGRQPAGRHRRACRGDRWPREPGGPFRRPRGRRPAAGNGAGRFVRLRPARLCGFRLPPSRKALRRTAVALAEAGQPEVERRPQPSG